MLRRIWIPITGVSWRDILLRFVVLQSGLMLYGFSIALMVDANVGASPWDVLAMGVSLNTPLSFGISTAVISVFVLLLWIPLRQKVGIGSLLNGFTVGLWADVGFMFTPTPDALWIRALQFLFGMVLLAWATAMYISADYGPGPRDGLMTGLTRVTKWPLWIIRTMIEVTVVAIGWMLGGPVGVGTVVFALCIGPCIGWFAPWWRRWMHAYRVHESKRVQPPPDIPPPAA